MREDDLMKYYVLMNNFLTAATPEFIYGVIDTERRVKVNGVLEGSKKSFPYYLKDTQCPDQLFLLCEKTHDELSFDYYKLGSAHIISDRFFNLLKSLKSSKYLAKKLTAVSIENDATIRSDLNYVYFIDDINFIDEELSKLEDDKFGNIIPHTLAINSHASKYDFFSINKTLLSGYIFLTELTATKISNAPLDGIKIVDLKDAFKHHCADYHYDIELSRKPTKKKLP